jgi:hypothetical protein
MLDINIIPVNPIIIPKYLIAFNFSFINSEDNKGVKRTWEYINTEAIPGGE